MEIRVLSEMARVFPDGVPARSGDISELYAFSGESAAFQIAYSGSGASETFQVETESDIETDLYHIRCMPVGVSGKPEEDDDYLREEAGLFPDFLDYKAGGSIFYCSGTGWQSLYFLCEKLPAGKHVINVVFRTYPGREILCKTALALNVSPEKLPEQTRYYTRWFHCDSLADCYNVPVFSERHWEITENFLKKASQRGMNTVLTPIHTPPLDTEEGRERKTTQLVDIEDRGGGRYGFSFEKLDRWFEICRNCGIKYFEMAHLFSQWGLKAAPKITAKGKDGILRRIFGWDTDSESAEYMNFLSQYLKSLYAHLQKLGIEKNCFFHISDEPDTDSAELYMRLKKRVQSILPTAYFLDALSDIDFYKNGACEHPIPSAAHIEPFFKSGVPGLWTYYCCAERQSVPNSFIAMPGERLRVLGILMYAYDIKGFLQWGYNYY